MSEKFAILQHVLPGDSKPRGCFIVMDLDRSVWVGGAHWTLASARQFVDHLERPGRRKRKAA